MRAPQKLRTCEFPCVEPVPHLFHIDGLLCALAIDMCSSTSWRCRFGLGACLSSLVIVLGSSRTVQAAPKLHTGSSSRHSTALFDDNSASARRTESADCTQLAIDWQWPTTQDGSVPQHGQPSVLQATGCAGDRVEKIDYVWTTSGGTLSAAAQRASLLAPNTGATVTVSVCAKRGKRSLACVAATQILMQPQPIFAALNNVATFTFGVGQVRGFTGRVDNLDAVAVPYRVHALNHTDVFYWAGSSPIAADGTFALHVFSLENVDRVSFAVLPETVNRAGVPGCTVTHCLALRHPVTRAMVPMIAAPSTSQPSANAALAVSSWLRPRGTSAEPAVRHLENMFAQTIITGPAGSGALLRARREGDVYFTYDQAIAATAFVVADQQMLAQTVLTALANVQRDDGSWLFAYQANGASAYATGQEVRYTGANAWVANAFIAYQARYHDSRYATTLAAAMAYLRSQQVIVDATEGKEQRALRFHPTDVSATSWDETQMTAVEHNAEAYTALQGYAVLTGVKTDRALIAGIRRYLAARWNGSYFVPGVHLTEGPNLDERYLDTQTYGILALGKRRYRAGIKSNCADFYDDASVLPARGTAGIGLRGFFDFQWTNARSAPHRFVWAEGTLGMIVAMQQAVNAPTCNGRTAADLFDQLGAVVALDDADLTPTLANGIAEATLTSNADYSTSSSTAALAWYVFAAYAVNPLRTWEASLTVPLANEDESADAGELLVDGAD